MRSAARHGAAWQSAALFHGPNTFAPCTMLSGGECSGKQLTNNIFRDHRVSCPCQRCALHSLASVDGCRHNGLPPMLAQGTDPFRDTTSRHRALRPRLMHSSAVHLQETSTDVPNSVAAALEARPPEPPLPYDSDENSVTGAGEAPFIPPQVDKLIKVIMRHGKKEQARRIVFNATQALYNSSRAKNPRPELRQRHKDFTR